VKTGTTAPAGNCLVASGRRGDDRLIVVVLGAGSADARYADTRNLFRWAWRQRGHKSDGAVAPKEGPLAGAVVVVDPGHGGQRYSRSYTGGTRGVVSRQTESELNLRVAVELARVLREKGATVHLTREADYRLSREGSSNKDELHARIDFFEHHACHFFLSVHHNAGGPKATGHTALYKHNAADDTLYEALARDVNDALEGAVQGPKLRLIKGSYHILRETPIPGTIAEAGFLTNREFDELSSRPDYPRKEAEAIARGAAKYWTEHKAALVALREKLAKDRAVRPRDPKTHTAVALNPDFRARMADLLAQVAPGGAYDPAKVGEYVAGFKKVAITDPKATFAVTAAFDGRVVRLAGETSHREYHDRLIDLLVAMRLFDITNEIRIPRAPR
jgi:N-acetylmuramoyl-L-alanine amidase